MSITDTSTLLSCHLYAACRNAIDRLLKRPSRISLAVTATSYMEGSQPFIYRYAPRGTRTDTLVYLESVVPVPMSLYDS